MRGLHQQITYTLVISSALMHVFCCGLPLLLTLVNLSTIFGIAGANALHVEWFERMEIYILIASGALLTVTALVQYISYRIDCRTQGSCVHAPCDNKKRLAARMFKFAVLLYVVNLVAYMYGHGYMAEGLAIH